MPFVLTQSELLAIEAPEELRARFGGKAVGLVRLLRLGCEVPPFFAVSAEARPDDEASRERLASEVRAELERLGPGPYAVRSSGVDEDGAKLSHAGQFESVLGPRSVGEVLEAMDVCWRSADGERVRAYRRIHGLPASPVAVIVQRLVPADVAGVLFSGTPETPGTVLISATLGLGEGVVQGQLACDTWRVDERGVIAAELEAKASAMVADEGRTTEQLVPLEQQRQACLSDATVGTLAATARRLVKATGGHVDLEFAVHEGKVWWLQLRPVTVPIPAGRRLLWDNSNIVESFNGPTTPMTFSFASRAYTIIYQLFCRTMGVDAATVQAHASTFQRMIGLVRGRIYYNLNAWYLVLRLLPGFRFTRGWMEQMMGVAEVASDEDALADWRPRSKLSDAVRGLWAAMALVWRLCWLNRDIARYRREFEATWAAHPRSEFSRKDLLELIDLYDVLERRLLWTWTPPIVNDFFAMIFVGLLRRQCTALVGGPGAEALHNDLLAAEGELESTAPTREALRLARQLRERAELLALFRSELDDRAVYVRAREDSWLAAELDAYIERYGDRCVDELKLETLSLRQRPEFLISVLRNYLRPGVRGEVASPDGEADRAVRTQAERRVFEALRGRPVKAALFRWVLAQARTRVKDREALRFIRTRVFGLVRDLVRAMGTRLVGAGALARADDVFWLSLDEVFAWARGTAITTNLGALVAVRRAELDAHRAAPPPAERFHTWGPVAARNTFQSARPTSDRAAADELFGTPCFPGQVEGEARVLADASGGAALRGEILVAQRTDPGWIPLYPSISGLVVERGSVLSHSAVVAREMGIPTIVGVRGLTAAIADGDRVRMDGAAGSVRRVA